MSKKKKSETSKDVKPIDSGIESSGGDDAPVSIVPDPSVDLADGAVHTPVDNDSEPMGDSPTPELETAPEVVPVKQTAPLSALEQTRIKYQAMHPTAKCVVTDLGGGRFAIDYINER